MNTAQLARRFHLFRSPWAVSCFLLLLLCSVSSAGSIAVMRTSERVTIYTERPETITLDFLREIAPGFSREGGDKEEEKDGERSYVFEKGEDFHIRITVRSEPAGSPAGYLEEFLVEKEIEERRMARAALQTMRKGGQVKIHVFPALDERTRRWVVSLAQACPGVIVQRKPDPARRRHLPVLYGSGGELLLGPKGERDFFGKLPQGIYLHMAPCVKDGKTKLVFVMTNNTPRPFHTTQPGTRDSRLEVYGRDLVLQAYLQWERGDQSVVVRAGETKVWRVDMAECFSRKLQLRGLDPGISYICWKVDRSGHKARPSDGEKRFEFAFVVPGYYESEPIQWHFSGEKEAKKKNED